MLTTTVEINSQQVLSLALVYDDAVNVTFVLDSKDIPTHG